MRDLMCRIFSLDPGQVNNLYNQYSLCLSIEYYLESQPLTLKGLMPNFFRN